MTSSLAPRFNLAAVPVDPAVHEVFFNAAASLRDFADGYLLARDTSLPHVSLCHFRAADDDAARALTQDFTGLDLTLFNTGTYVLAGTAEHTGKFWGGIIERRSAPLMALQAKTVATLRQTALEIFHSSGDAYFPHFTLVRSAVPPPLQGAEIFSDKLIGREIACRVCLGRSDENGQLTKILAGGLPL